MKTNNWMIFLLICIIVAASSFGVLFSHYENFENKKKCAVAVVSRNINEQWLDFLNGFYEHDCYLFIDNMETDISKVSEKYKNVKILQIPNEECEKHGFINSSTINNMPRIISWDRALYHMCCNEPYEKTWFIEDDVFFFSEKTLSNMETKHINVDMLLSNSSKSQQKDGWVWWDALKSDVKEPPYAHSLIVCSLMSRNIMDKIKEHAQQHKKLYFIEALFPILAHTNNLTVSDDPEYLGVKNVSWPNIHQTVNDFTPQNKDWVYHPVKDMNTHVEWRKHISSIYPTD